MTAQPLRQDKYVITKQDWRTYHRLIIFREIVLKEILGKAVRVFFFLNILFFLNHIYLLKSLTNLFNFYMLYTLHILMLYQVNSKHPGEVKMDFVPAFASTLSMFDKMCDNGNIVTHYYNIL